jgi:hypothetical protein
MRFIIVALFGLSSVAAKSTLLSKQRAKIPAIDPQAISAQVGEAFSSTAAGKKILVVGDSWGTVTAVGSALNVSFFERALSKHGCDATSASIAIPGTMATDWDNGLYLAAAKLSAKLADYVWIVLMGNDALDEMPDCADTGKSADECAGQLVDSMLVHMGRLIDEVHTANPSARIVGFGYDTMFGGLGCELVPRELFPQCYKGTSPAAGGNRCFNTQFLKIQQVWETLAANRTYLDATSILGATQVAAGDANASTSEASRHIDMDKMGPAKYWPAYEGCFHPGVFGGDDSGAMVVMEEFHRAYWSDALGC